MENKKLKAFRVELIEHHFINVRAENQEDAKKKAIREFDYRGKEYTVVGEFGEIKEVS